MEVGFSVVSWHCWEPCIIFDKCVVCACVCMPHFFLSFSSHLRLEWDESLPHYPALHSSMNCEADISFFGGLEGNEWWQHNGIVSTDGKLESWGDTLLYPPLLSVSESGPVWGVKRVWVEFEHLYIVEGHSAPEQNVTEVQGAWEETEERAVPNATQLFRDAAGFKESKQIIH